MSDYATIGEKIVPFVAAEEPCLLSRHNRSIQEEMEKTFSKELPSQEELEERLPLIEWTIEGGTLQIFLLCKAHKARQIQLFFTEMVSDWLLPGKSLPLLLSRNFTFSLYETPLFFAELLLEIEKEEQLPTIEKKLPSLVDEIKLGIASSGSTQHILEMKRLPLGDKSSYVYGHIVSLLQRHPKRFDHTIFRDMQHFLVHCRQEFCALRRARHLSRIVCSHYLFQKALHQDTLALPQKRYLYLKLARTQLHYPFGIKKVLGLVIALNSLHEYECFEQRHILRACQRLLPQVSSIKDSFYSQLNEENRFLMVYLEIEKSDGSEFTREELLRLRQELPAELKTSVEYLSPSLFIPRNEEELYRTIISLSQELKFVRDLPQAAISFVDQRYDTIVFNAVVLRILQENTPSLTEQSRLLPKSVHFQPERVAHMGLIRKKYVKEANVFSLEIDSKRFLRKNHSVDLIRARQYVVKLVEKLVGPFRDYNGGFLRMQNTQLEAIKAQLGAESSQYEFLLENLFYSLSPSIVQTSISHRDGKHLFSLFQKMLETEVRSNQKCIVHTHSTPSSFFLMIKSPHAISREEFLPALKGQESDLAHFATASVDVEGYHYLAFLLLNSSRERQLDLESQIHLSLETWIRKRHNTQSIHLQLPRAALSLDPRIGTDRTSGIVLKMLYEGLMRIGQSGEPEPALAERVEISPDSTVFTFYLKKTLWSNGSPVTAEDFAYAWKKVFTPHHPSPYAFLLFCLKNSEKAKRGEVSIEEVGVEAIDTYTLRVECEYPSPHFLGLTAHWTCSPLCKEVDQRHPGWAYHNGEAYVCNGPFKLDIWKPNDDLQVVANPLYWDAPKVHLERIHLSILDDDFASAEMFKRGELDWYGDPFTKIPAPILPYFKKSGLLQYEDLTGLFWLQLNVGKLPFRTPLMRHAFSYAIDRRKLGERTLQNQDTPATRFLQNCSLENPHALEPFNPEKARLTFEQGLKELGLKREDLPPIVFTHSDYDEHELIAKTIGEQWSAVLGVEMRYERYKWHTFFDLVARQEHMVTGFTWFARHTDPLYYLDVLINREHAVRVTLWKNAHFRSLIEKAKRTFDPQMREALSLEAESIALKELPVIPILRQKNRFVKNPRLKNVIQSQIGQIDFREAYLEDIQNEVPSYQTFSQ